MDVLTISPAVLFSGLLALVLEWMPGVAEKWAGLSPGKKAALNALGVAVITAVSVIGACYWWGDTCPEGGVLRKIGEILLVFVLSFGTAQGLHRGTKRELFGMGFKAKAKTREY